MKRKLINEVIKLSLSSHNSEAKKVFSLVYLFYRPWTVCAVHHLAKRGKFECL